MAWKFLRLCFLRFSTVFYAPTTLAWVGGKSRTSRAGAGAGAAGAQHLFFSAPSRQLLTSSASPTLLHQSQASSNFLSLDQCLSFFDNQVDDNGCRVKFVDGTWFHKGDRNGRHEFMQGPRIPGSVYFDIDDISATNPGFQVPGAGDSDVPNLLLHMLPSPSLFATAINAMNITQQDHVIVYGRKGHLFLPRIWFNFHIMQQRRVSIMDGCLQDWITLGGPVDSKFMAVPKVVDLDWSQLNRPPTTFDGGYSSKLQSVRVATKQQVLEALAFNDTSTAAGNFVLLDARGSSFRRKGHIPGSIHIPYSSLVSPQRPDLWKSPDELRHLFQSAGVDLLNAHTTIICTCGSGVSACSLYLALQECGRLAEVGFRTAVYDGSWDEWSKDDLLPKVLPIL